MISSSTGGVTTRYLYGNGAIGEDSSAWVYPLRDGTNTSRQLLNAAGEIILTKWYTPWGDMLNIYINSGLLTNGYFGGIMDYSTGLIYLGNGQYYDPQTGRFLNRNANPNQTNPYVPWKGDPAGAMISPLVVLALAFSFKKKRGKWDKLIIILALVLSVGMGLAACGGTGGTTNISGEGTPTIPPGGGGYTQGETDGGFIPTTNYTAVERIERINCGETQDGLPKDILTPTLPIVPIPSDDTLSTVVNEETGYSGLQMYDLYLWCKSWKDKDGKPMWWNEHGLSEWKFFGWMMQIEMSFAIGAKLLLIDAASLHIWGHVDNLGVPDEYCKTPSCVYGIFNFLADYVAAAHNKYEIAIAKPSNSVYTDFPYYQIKKDWDEAYRREVIDNYHKVASEMGDAIRSNTSYTYWTNEKPYHWGNYSNCPVPDYLFKADTFYVLNQRQRDLIQCDPSVR
jgi:hypothetical protein